MSVVANVAINVDSRDAVSKLRQVQAQSQATERSFLGLSRGVERSKTGFASASEVQSVFAAKVRNTENAIRAQIAGLRDIQGRVQFNGALYQKAAEQIRQYEAVLARANQTQKNQAGSASAAVASLGRLAAAYIGLRTAQEAIQAGIQREESQRRLTFLAKGYGEVARAQELAAQSGKLFGLSATESNQQFAQLYGRLRPLNVSVEDINAAFVGFNTAAKVSGTTAAESAGAFLQLTQALGSGVLRGQELNSVLEQAPGVVVALTKELGVPVSQIRKLAEDGKITSDVVIRALKRAGTEGADELAAAMNGPAQAVKNLQNESENFQVAATQELLPSIIDGVRILTNTLKGIAPIIRGIGAVAGPVLNYINSLIEKATGIEQARFKATMTQRAGAARLERAGVGRTYSDAQGNVYSTITGRLVKAAPSRTASAAAPPPPDPTGGGGGGRTGASEAEQAAKRLAEEIKRSFEEGKNLTREFERQKAFLNATTDFDRQRLQIQFEYQDNVRKIAELKNAEQAIAATILNREIRKLKILELQREEQEAIRDLLESTFKDMPAAGTGKEDSFRAIFDQRIPDAIQQIKDRLKELTDPVNQIIGAATAIGDAFAESFRGVVSGSMTAQQALASFFQSVANHFIDMAAQIAAEAIKLQAIQILQSLLRPLLSGGFGVAGPGMDLPGLSGAGALGGAPITPGGVFAEGGFVTGPTNALIGEGGEPEYVIPASKMRSAMGRYAAGARGSSVIPSSAGGDGGPNQPGGAATSSIDVRYTVERINSVDYVTADQFQAGMQQAASQGAQRGEQRALRTLQQSTSIRSKVGMR